MPRVFMRSAWRNLLMVNYAIDPAALGPLVPKGTELETWDGVTLASVVGFQFLNTRVFGIPLLFHGNFPEVNLRFYVRRKVDGSWRGGVVFVREIVPRWAWAVAVGARTLYRERYVALPMKSAIRVPGEIRFAWKHGGAWDVLHADTTGEACTPDSAGVAHYVSEHYWGYAAQRDGGTLQYEVEHPPWKVWNCEKVRFDCRVKELYGPPFVDALSGTPHSAFAYDGSNVVVRAGTRIA